MVGHGWLVVLEFSGKGKHGEPWWLLALRYKHGFDKANWSNLLTWQPE